MKDQLISRFWILDLRQTSVVFPGNGLLDDKVTRAC